jgi:hypothetical protein
VHDHGLSGRHLGGLGGRYFPVPIEAPGGDHLVERALKQEVIPEALRHAKGFTRVLGQDAVIDCHHERFVTSALGMAARGAG